MRGLRRCAPARAADDGGGGAPRLRTRGARGRREDRSWPRAGTTIDLARRARPRERTPAEAQAVAARSTPISSASQLRRRARRRNTGPRRGHQCALFHRRLHRPAPAGAAAHLAAFPDARRARRSFRLESPAASRSAGTTSAGRSNGLVARSSTSVVELVEELPAPSRITERGCPWNGASRGRWRARAIRTGCPSRKRGRAGERSCRPAPYRPSSRITLFLEFQPPGSQAADFAVGGLRIGVELLRVVRRWRSGRSPLRSPL